MSAKKKTSAASAPTGRPAAAVLPAVAEPVDPRRRLIANLTLAGLGLYVALIWLLALDQQFHWGLFKP